MFLAERAKARSIKHPPESFMIVAPSAQRLEGLLTNCAQPERKRLPIGTLMRKSPLVFIALAAALSAPLCAHAMIVPLDHSTRLTVPGAASSVIVGNPSIADVTVVDSHTLYVSGRGYGSTDLQVLDRSGRPLYSEEIDVLASGASVSVYHGNVRVDTTCDPRCGDSRALSASEKLTDAQAASVNQSVSSAKANASAATSSSAVPTAVGMGSLH